MVVDAPPVAATAKDVMSRLCREKTVCLACDARKALACAVCATREVSDDGGER